YGEADEITALDIYDVKMSSADFSPLTVLYTMAIENAGLDEDHIKMPASPVLAEVNLSGNEISGMTFGQYPDLKSLSLSYNLYESFDASVYPKLEVLSLGFNKLTDVTLDNPNLWGIELAANELESISLSGLPALHQLYVDGNKLSTIDVAPVAETLTVLDISNNYFTFATLPDVSGMATLNQFYYGNQAPLDVECVDGRVDLSEQAMVGDTPTEYYWFLGEVYVDPETGGVVGELLESSGDDPEYTVTDGVTGFHYTFSDKVTGLLINAEYPYLALFTKPVIIDTTVGIQDATVDVDPDAIVDVFTTSGICVRRGVRAAEALDGLERGIYLVGSRKVYVAR
ncbi:MAG: leucine-rich repeat domain-containing protein, partial [Muribaculaceae bacterium]|nr:leucine-rich repeat domain-containing protein [Muribaculaceae bacterium]